MTKAKATILILTNFINNLIQKNMKTYGFYLTVYYYENTILKSEIRKIIFETIGFFHACERLKELMLQPNIKSYEIESVFKMNSNI